MAASPELIHAYRSLLRATLRAVQYSQPSRTTITQQLRAGFRDPHGTLDTERVRHTVWFMNAAAQQRGLEHKILKNLCRVHWERANERSRMPWRLRVRKMEMGEEKAEKARKGGKEVKEQDDPISGTQYDHYEQLIAGTVCRTGCRLTVANQRPQCRAPTKGIPPRRCCGCRASAALRPRLRLMPVGAEPMRCTAAGFTTELELHFGFPNEGLIVVCTHSEEVRLVEWLPFRNRATLTPNSRTLLRIARSRSTGCAVGLKTGAKVQGSMGYRLSHPVARPARCRCREVLVVLRLAADTLLNSASDGAAMTLPLLKCSPAMKPSSPVPHANHRSINVTAANGGVAISP
ncbi:hypothetical protein CHGG_07895 [Chaetomium globosum CBS 148.51]|uniref:Uncharacterized protein n=1 Tax=Chaetomium globosum (strain ATCC 6205 / CBS 148.51 / DSM 1962 / NBRC 6347 / NRRL 1970) TaxID=306901 RepID=Q2GVV9_CHAGB|nr:uncharacterized protein CHGG_07895 [Chaetomium globosum CBS 148.51]EAQ86642.1 hypothetical protein CHGG_07895 [Chaetomium globosum CBS 148.51]